MSANSAVNCPTVMVDDVLELPSTGIHSTLSQHLPAQHQSAASGHGNHDVHNNLQFNTKHQTFIPYYNAPHSLRGSKTRKTPLPPSLL